MKLLILTQKIDKNDDLLGFFHDWLLEFAKICESVIVICLQMGDYELPENVTVYSLGKEKKGGKISYLINFYKLIYVERNNYEAVFVHMNQIYVLLGGLLWRYWEKKVGLWYTHRAVTTTLKLAEKLVDFVFTSTEKGFNVPTKKLHVLDHGISIEKFSGPSQHYDGVFRVVCIGRLSPIKNQLLLVQALELLSNGQREHLEVLLVGGVHTQADKAYAAMLRERVKLAGLEEIVKFEGSIPNMRMPELISHADVSVNLAPLGALDKVIIESMAGGSLPIVLNQSFIPFLGEHPAMFLLEHPDPESLKQKIMMLRELDMESRLSLQAKLREATARDFPIAKLIKNIISRYA
ncbi:MAG TPA: glycosyltransferase [Patescibacteria group bacterium]|nr:glycosyltransferase [Patescibacteria group bacterium]